MEKRLKRISTNRITKVILKKIQQSWLIWKEKMTMKVKVVKVVEVI